MHKGLSGLAATFGFFSGALLMIALDVAVEHYGKGCEIDEVETRPRRISRNRRCWTGTIVEEVRVQNPHLRRQFSLDDSQLWVHRNESQNRSCGQSRAVARNDQLVAFLARRPVTHTLADHAGSNVAYETPRRMPPSSVGRGAEIT
jgi:hypothetical protein